MEGFSAHIRERDGARQTVEEHIRGTAEKAERYGGTFSCSRMGRLVGLLHDEGKMCRDFNDYIEGRNQIQRGEIDHCYPGAKHLMELAEGTGDKDLKGTAQFAARVILSHHGLCDWIDKEGEDYFRRRIGKTERYEEISGNYRGLVSDEELLRLLREASVEYKAIRKRITALAKSGTEGAAGTGRPARGKQGPSYMTQKSFYLGLYERLMLSALVDGDRTDTVNFSCGEETEKRWDASVWEEAHRRMEEKHRAFAQNENKIARLRCDISDRCAAFAHHKVGICRLIVPTGGGKTLSSLRFAIDYCREHGMDRIFYISPFLSILEQNSGVIRDIVGDECLLEHHSDILDGKEDGKELSEYELRTDQWDMPVIATTMVQFLNTFFSGKMSCVRRMHQLCHAVILLDEVQSIPTECVSLFNLAMNFIAQIGDSCVVLCSATQPSLESIRWRLILDEQESMTGDYTEDFRMFQRTETIPLLRPSGYTCAEAAAFCLEKYRAEGSILFVVNTKSVARKIYERVKEQVGEETEVVHLSTNLCPENRRRIIEEMKGRLDAYGKSSKMICVTTQLIEAGVDISFPCVIRSLAGMDHAAQAGGRCNRNGEYGERGNVYLINLSEERLGSLQDIQKGQSIAEQMIAGGRYEDVLAPDTMQDYFRKFYMESSKYLDFCTDDVGGGTTLLCLLSTDLQRWGLKIHRGMSCHAQAFRTAGQKFHVIGEDTMSVLVPYNEEAEELIRILASEQNPHETANLLRKAQKFSVEFYPNEMANHKEALVRLPCDAWVLKKDFYDDKLGVLRERKPMGLLMWD